MKRLSCRSILQRVEGRRIVGLWYGVEDGYLRFELDDGSVVLIAATWEGCHIMVDVPGGTAGLAGCERAHGNGLIPPYLPRGKGRPMKEPPLCCQIVAFGDQYWS